LVGWHEGAGNVVGHEVGLGGDVQELDHVVVAHEATTACVGKGLRGNDLPVVVYVLMTIPCHLLTCARVSNTG
jgi:hypothetical protein